VIKHNLRRQQTVSVAELGDCVWRFRSVSGLRRERFVADADSSVLADGCRVPLLRVRICKIVDTHAGHFAQLAYTSMQRTVIGARHVRCGLVHDGTADRRTCRTLPTSCGRLPFCNTHTSTKVFAHGHCVHTFVKETEGHI
jgi:hypothetical protein